MFRFSFLLCGVNDTTGGLHNYTFRSLIACCNRNSKLLSMNGAKVRNNTGVSAIAEGESFTTGWAPKIERLHCFPPSCPTKKTKKGSRPFGLEPSAISIWFYGRL
jgi:hypothetical protein